MGLLGPNGAGKSTTFNIIAGLFSPDSGSISYNGHELVGLPMYKRTELGIAYLAQKPSVFKNLSLTDNMKIHLADLEVYYQHKKLLCLEYYTQIQNLHLL